MEGYASTLDAVLGEWGHCWGGNLFCLCIPPAFSCTVQNQASKLLAKFRRSLWKNVPLPLQTGELCCQFDSFPALYQEQGYTALYLQRAMDQLQSHNAAAYSLLFHLQCWSVTVTAQSGSPFIYEWWLLLKLPFVNYQYVLRKTVYSVIIS